MVQDDEIGQTPLCCERCAAKLRPGRGDLYLVRIEAIADPTPPIFSQEDLDADHQREIERLLGELQDISDQELANQVYRRLSFCLCGPCYRQWIEKPTSSFGTSP